MKFSIRALTLAAVGLLTIATAAVAPVRPAAAQGMTYYIWCVVPDYRTGTAYFSSIFTASEADIYSHAVPFTNVVQSRYSQTAQLGQCRTNETYEYAQQTKTLEMSRTVFDHNIDIGWRP
jgi:hypothetical protein